MKKWLSSLPLFSAVFCFKRKHTITRANTQKKTRYMCTALTHIQAHSPPAHRCAFACECKSVRMYFYCFACANAFAIYNKKTPHKRAQQQHHFVSLSKESDYFVVLTLIFFTDRLVYVSERIGRRLSAIHTRWRLASVHRQWWLQLPNWSCRNISGTCAHELTHPHMRTRTHTPTHAYTYSHTHASPLTHLYSYTYIHLHALPHTRAHILVIIELLNAQPPSLPQHIGHAQHPLHFLRTQGPITNLFICFLFEGWSWWARIWFGHIAAVSRSCCRYAPILEWFRCCST